jgi:hypothetical protein
MFDQTTKHTFLLALAHAQLTHEQVRNATSPVSDFVASAREREYYVSDDLKSGFAVCEDGELTGVFSTVKGRGAALIATALHRGATFLSCFDGFLPGLYARFGFIKVGSERNWGGDALPRCVHMALGSESTPLQLVASAEVN